MIAKLAFHRAVDFAQRLLEDHLIDGADHLSRTHLAQIAAQRIAKAAIRFRQGFDSQNRQRRVGGG